jgi:hypothetical protein
MKERFIIDHPNKWGPIFWRIIHWAAMKHDLTPNVGATKTFMYSLHGIIPCHKCAHDYSRWIYSRQFDQALARRKVFEWSVRLHNHVSGKLVTKNLPTVQQATDMVFSDKNEEKYMRISETKELIISCMVLGFGFVIAYGFIRLMCCVMHALKCLSDK